MNKAVKRKPILRLKKIHTHIICYNKEFHQKYTKQANNKDRYPRKRTKRNSSTFLFRDVSKK